MTPRSQMNGPVHTVGMAIDQVGTGRDAIIRQLSFRLCRHIGSSHRLRLTWKNGDCHHSERKTEIELVPSRVAVAKYMLWFGGCRRLNYLGPECSSSDQVGSNVTTSAHKRGHPWLSNLSADCISVLVVRPRGPDSGRQDTPLDRRRRLQATQTQLAASDSTSPLSSELQTGSGEKSRTTLLQVTM